MHVVDELQKGRKSSSPLLPVQYPGKLFPQKTLNCPICPQIVDKLSRKELS